MKHLNPHVVLETTSRVEAYSDAIMAIAMTILILEIQVPHLADLANTTAWEAVREVLPEFASFVLSFITLAVVWVNHHAFFHMVRGTDSKLLWRNNFLMLAVCVIPFVTAFLGEYPMQPVVVFLYGVAACMMALTFNRMVKYVFFNSNLLPDIVSIKDRQAEYRRSFFGVYAYGAGAVLSFVHPAISLVLYVLVLVFYFIPNPFADAEAHHNHSHE